MVRYYVAVSYDVGTRNAPRYDVMAVTSHSRTLVRICETRASARRFAKVANTIATIKATDSEYLAHVATALKYKGGIE